MTLALARSLLLAEAVTPEALADALLLSATHGISLVRALLATGAMQHSRLEEHLERGEAPYRSSVVPERSLMHDLPAGLSERLLALPVGHDPLTGAVDVAVVDACDPHPAREVGHWLNAPVRTVRTSLSSLDAALQRIRTPPEGGLHALAPPIWMPSPSDPPRAAVNTPAHGFNAPVDPNIPFALTRKSLPPRSKASLPPGTETSGQPVTQRGPFGHPVARSSPVHATLLANVAPILDQIREAHDRDAILELVVVGARTVAHRAAVLAVRNGALIGWTCSPELAERADLRKVRLSATGTALSPALDHDGARLVRIPFDTTHAPLLWVMNTPPRAQVALVAVRVEGKPVALVLADDLREPLLAARRLEEIARVAGAAIAEVLRRRRKLAR
jgi:type II secretion system (T2SS) protein E